VVARLAHAPFRLLFEDVATSRAQKRVGLLRRLLSTTSLDCPQRLVLAWAPHGASVSRYGVSFHSILFAFHVCNIVSRLG
jgi:hypothetical protein